MGENKESSGKFDKIDFEGMDIGKFVELFLKCETKEDTDDILGQYLRYCDVPTIVMRNLGHIFGYANEEDRKKLYALFPVTRPIFDQDF